MMEGRDETHIRGNAITRTLINRYVNELIRAI